MPFLTSDDQGVFSVTFNDTDMDNETYTLTVTGRPSVIVFVLICKSNRSFALQKQIQPYVSIVDMNTNEFAWPCQFDVSRVCHVGKPGLWKQFFHSSHRRLLGVHQKWLVLRAGGSVEHLGPGRGREEQRRRVRWTLGSAEHHTVRPGKLHSSFCQRQTDLHHNPHRHW